MVLINPEDMRRLGLAPDQPVTVRSAVGELRRRLARPYDIRPGNAAMYYPEANVLIPRDVDPQSKTPAFKSVLVELVAEVASRLRLIGFDAHRLNRTILQRHYSCFLSSVRQEAMCCAHVL